MARASSAAWRRAFAGRRRVTRKNFERLWLRQHGAAERNFASALLSFFKAQAKSIAKQARAAGDPESLKASDLFSPAKWDAKLKQTVRAPWLRAAGRGAKLEQSLLPSGQKKRDDEDILGAFDIPDDVMASISRQLADTMRQPFWKNINRVTLNHLETAIARGIDEGDGLDEMVKRLTGVVGSPARALSIARTETTGAVNAGHYSAREPLIEEGLITGSEWLSMGDDLVRDDHADANGQIIGPGEMFIVGGEECPYPGHWSLSAAQRCNCVIDPETPILTIDGPMPVKLIRVGQLVLTHRGRWRRVLRLAQERHYTGPAAVLAGTGLQVMVTLNHPVLTGQGWVVAGKLLEGDMLLSASLVQGPNLLANAALFSKHFGPVSELYESQVWQRQHNLRDFSLDDEVGHQFDQEIASLVADDVPATYEAPMHFGGLLLPAHHADSGGGAEKPNQRFMAIRDDDVRAEVVRHPGVRTPIQRSLGGLGDRSLHDRHDAFAIDHGGNISTGDGIHVALVPRHLRLAQIEKVRNVQLFNFAVEEDESYFAGGLAVHNCRCVSVASGTFAD